MMSESVDEKLFSNIASDIQLKGYSINPAALSIDLAQGLAQHLRKINPQKFNLAGVGRTQDYRRNNVVRSDDICWIAGEAPVEREWLHWADQLQSYLNQNLFMGLFSFESHFAHYRPGDCYQRHVDAFKGEANRMLSVLVYLNTEWVLEDGGELVLFMDEHDRQGIKVVPSMATVVVFLSEEFPHEVLSADRDRYSIAGWYRVNTSTFAKADPPR